MSKAQVVGVGMVPFAKPGKQEPYEVMAGKAIRNALADAGLDLADVRQAYASYVYGDSTCGQTALYGVGMTGIPVINVNNNCSSGSTALFLARQLVESGAVAGRCRPRRGTGDRTARLLHAQRSHHL